MMNVRRKSYRPNFSQIGSRKFFCLHKHQTFLRKYFLVDKSQSHQLTVCFHWKLIPNKFSNYSTHLHSHCLWLTILSQRLGHDDFTVLFGVLKWNAFTPCAKKAPKPNSTQNIFTWNSLTSRSLGEIHWFYFSTKKFFGWLFAPSKYFLLKENRMNFGCQSQHKLIGRNSHWKINTQTGNAVKKDAKRSTR